MKFTLSIEMDNAAFIEETEGREVASILHNLADHVDGFNFSIGTEFPLYDCNGNRVGIATVESE